MAYMTVRLSAGSYDPVSNSTPVSATVSITWDTAQSYDQTNDIATLTIGNYSTTFYANYNASRTQSGTDVLGTGSTTIYHNSSGDPVQVVASATSSRYSASDIITLSGGTPSGGSSGGDSGDDNEGGDSGGDSGGNEGGSTTTHTITLSSTEHVTLMVCLYKPESIMNGTVLQNGTILQDGEQIRIFYSADDGYELTKHTINGVEFNSGDIFTVTSDIHIVVGVFEDTTETTVFVSNGSGFTPYTIHIDNGSGWEMYAAYIDDGTSWHLYS